MEHASGNDNEKKNHFVVLMDTENWYLLKSSQFRIQKDDKIQRKKLRYKMEK